MMVTVISEMTPRAMKISSFNAVHCLILSVLTYLASTTEIVQPPSDTTVFLGESAVFECVLNSDFSGWRVNGTPFDRLDLDIRNDLMTPDQPNTKEGNILIQLIIPARAEYNGTRVQCVIPGHKSENVTMNIQGLLSSVRNLRTASSDTSSITISWTAPYSLDVTGVDPDIWYSVLIYIVTDDEPTLISCTDCINITDTHYTFTPDSPSPCHQYIFTVLPVNGAGQGETSQNITGYTIDGDFKVEFVRVGITAISTEKCNVTCQVCGELEGEYTYTFFGTTDLNEVITSRRNNLLLQSGGFLTFTLPANRTYSSYYITVGTENIPSNDKFTTFDIQNPTASKDGSNIKVEGEFISGTFATGCFILIQCNDSTADIYRALLRQGSEQTVSEVISVPPSIYTVYAYDLEENALPNPLPAVSSGTPINITSDYSMPESSSEFLTSVTLSQNGLEVFITCQVYFESSCVLVYREYGNTTLTVIEYPHSSEFPVNVTVDNPERYTFAIFGKNGTDIESEPVIAVRLEAIKTPPTPTSPGDNTTDKQVSVSGIVAGVMVAVIAALVIAVVAVSAVVYRKRKKVESSGVRVETGTPQSDEQGTSYVTVSHTPGVCPPPSMTPRINYEDIDHKATEVHRIREENANKKQPDKKTEPQKKPVVAPTVESVMDLLYDIRGGWQKIAEGLGFDEDMIDEIFTNNETDEACLMNCIEIWVQRLGPTWEKLSHVLANMGENQLADKACPSAAHDSGDSKGQDNDESCVAPSEVSDDDSGVSDLVSGQSGQQTPATNHGDHNRGHKMQVPLRDEYEEEEQQYMVQTALQEANDMSDNEVDDVVISQNEEENDDTKSEPPSCVECSSGDEDDDLTVLLGSTAHCLSSRYVKRGSGCFVEPPVPRSSSSSDCTDITVNDSEALSQPAPSEESHKHMENYGCCSAWTEMTKQETETWIILTRHHSLCMETLQYNHRSGETKNAIRNVCSDDGSVVVVPRSYTGFQATATDDIATNNRAIEPTTCFEELPPRNICAQATDTTHFQRNLIVPPAFSTFSEGTMVIGLYTRAKTIHNYTTAEPEPRPQSPPDTTLLQIQPLEILLPQTPPPDSALPQTPPPESALPQTPLPESALPQTPPPESTLPQTPPPESALPQTPPPEIDPPHANDIQHIPKQKIVDLPPEKPEWSDPPDNYHLKMAKWVHTGVSLGFHGPGHQLCVRELPVSSLLC